MTKQAPFGPDRPRRDHFEMAEELLNGGKHPAEIGLKAIAHATLAVADAIRENAPVELAEIAGQVIPLTPGEQDDSLVISLSAYEVELLTSLLEDAYGEMRRMPTSSSVLIWIDPIDRALKAKIGNGHWTAPMGTVAK